MLVLSLTSLISNTQQCFQIKKCITLFHHIFESKSFLNIWPMSDIQLHLSVCYHMFLCNGWICQCFYVMTDGQLRNHVKIIGFRLICLFIQFEWNKLMYHGCKLYILDLLKTLYNNTNLSIVQNVCMLLFFSMVIYGPCDRHTIIAQFNQNHTRSDGS